MSTWKYLQNGQAAGPVDTAALQALLSNGTLSLETPVCKEGATDWLPARSVPELAAAAPVSGAVPPVPTGSSAGASSLPPPPSAVTADTDAADIEKNKVFAVLAYLGPLFLVPLLAAPQSKFARYHANQGAVLFIATIVLCVGSLTLTLVPFVGCFASLLPLLVGLGALVLMILGIVNAAAGQCRPLPAIGQFQLIR